MTPSCGSCSASFVTSSLTTANTDALSAPIDCTNRSSTSELLDAFARSMASIVWSLKSVSTSSANRPVAYERISSTSDSMDPELKFVSASTNPRARCRSSSSRSCADSARCHSCAKAPAASTATSRSHGSIFGSPLRGRGPPTSGCASGAGLISVTGVAVIVTPYFPGWNFDPGASGSSVDCVARPTPLP
jgi:hypothetical protein